MKKLALTLVAGFALVLCSFANPVEVTPQIRESFENNFPKASAAIWTPGDEYARVSFLLGETAVAAYYNRDGKLLAVTRNLKFTELPLNLQADFRQRFEGKQIVECYEIGTDEGTNYYLTVEDSRKIFNLEAAQTNRWSVTGSKKKA